MNEFIVKLHTIPINGEDLWKKILHSLVNDEDWDIKQVVRKLLGLDKDKYAKIHGMSRTKKTPAPPPPKYMNKKQRATYKLQPILGKT